MKKLVKISDNIKKYNVIKSQFIPFDKSSIIQYLKILIIIKIMKNFCLRQNLTSIADLLNPCSWSTV